MKDKTADSSSSSRFPEQAVISPRQQLQGTVSVPGDKSISHRSLMLSSLAAGTSTITGLLEADDCHSTLAIMRQLGIKITRTDNGCFQVEGRGLQGLQEPKDVLDCGNSGTSMRLLTGLLAAQDFYSVLTGDSSLRSRPMARVTEPLSEMGARIWSRRQGLAPLSIHGASLSGITFHQPVASAQVKSCLLLAGLYTGEKTTVVEPAPSRDHTERMLQAAGVPLEIEEGVITLDASTPPRLEPYNLTVPGDISSAAFLLAAALMVPEGQLVIENVGINPTRSGILTALKKMGARLEIKNEREISGEPVADLKITSGPLQAIELSGEIIPSLIDEIPVLAVLATRAEGTTVISDAEELRVKETDRLAATARELNRLGAGVKEKEDGLEITGPVSLTGDVTVKSYHDHRIAMAMAVAGLAADREITIDNSKAISVSFPGFLDLLAEL